MAQQRKEMEVRNTEIELEQKVEIAKKEQEILVATGEVRRTCPLLLAAFRKSQRVNLLTRNNLLPHRSSGWSRNSRPR